MILSRSRRFLFAHVPKTAGSSMRSFLTQYQSSDFAGKFSWHTSLEEAQPNINIWHELFRFGFVRNPWEAQLSMYLYVLQKGSQHPDWCDVARCASFSTFICDHILDIWKSGSLRTQHTYLYNKEGRCLANFIGRFETLSRDFNLLRSSLNLAACGDLQRLNTTIHGDYRDYYNKTTRDIVSKIYEVDIDLFGYRFEG